MESSRPASSRSRRLDPPLRTTRAKKRDSLEIMSEVLEIAMKGSRKTGIMYKANLSYELLGEYLSLMRELQFLETRDKTYFSTARGMAFLAEFKKFCTLRDSVDKKAAELRKLLEQ